MSAGIDELIERLRNNEIGLRYISANEIMSEAAGTIERLQRELDEARKDAANLKGALIRVCTEADEFRAEWRINHPRNPPISESECITKAKLLLNSFDAARQPQG